ADSVTEVVAGARAAAAHIGVAPGALHEPDAADRLRRRASELLNATIANRLAPAELTWLTNLIELEMRATSILLGHLAERVGACDGRLISRLLPVLSAHEERVRDTRELLVRLPAARELTRRTPVLLQRLEDKGYDALVQRLAKRPDGASLANALVLSTWRAPLGRELAFFGGLVRVLGDRLGDRSATPVDPAHATLLALLARRDEGLALDLTPADARATRALWATFGLRAASGTFAIAYEAG